MQNLAERLAAMALEVIRTETPHCYDFHGPTPRPLTGGAPLPPKSIHPAFYGCFDWHSAVHSHWLLVELLRRGTTPRLHLEPGLVAEVTRQLTEALSAENCRREFEFLREHPRFERPYGLAWTLSLSAALSRTPALEAEYTAIRSLEQLCATRLLAWFESLPYPIRSGEHGQSAFALALFLDWATAATANVGEDFHARAAAVVLRHYAGDGAAALHLEPSGNDFLSPGLGAAHALSLVLDGDAFDEFCSGYFDPDRLLEPVSCPDPNDGRIAHLIGLNLSRAWMLAGIVRRLTKSPLRDALLASARAHRAAGLVQCACEDLVEADEAPLRRLTAHLPFMVSHWIGSFVLLMEDEVSSLLAT